MAVLPLRLGRQAIVRRNVQNLDLGDLLASTSIAFWRVLNQNRSLMFPESTEPELASISVVIGVSALVAAMAAQRITAL